MQHPVDLAEEPVQVVHAGQGEHAERAVERVGPHEGQLGQVALVQLDLDLGRVGRGPGRLDPVSEGSTPMTRAPWRARVTSLGAGADAEHEQAPALDVAEQAQLGLGGDVGSVADGVAGQVGRLGNVADSGGVGSGSALGRGRQVARGRVARADVAGPGEAVGHGRSLARPARRGHAGAIGEPSASDPASATRHGGVRLRLRLRRTPPPSSGPRRRGTARGGSS